MKEKLEKALELLDEARALFEELESDAHNEWVRAEDMVEECHWEGIESDFNMYSCALSEMHEEISEIEL